MLSSEFNFLAGLHYFILVLIRSINYLIEIKKFLIVKIFVVDIKYNSYYESGSLEKIIFLYLKTDFGTTESMVD